MTTTTTTIIKITTIITEQGDLEAHRRTEGLCGRTELQAILYGETEQPPHLCSSSYPAGVKKRR